MAFLRDGYETSVMLLFLIKWLRVFGCVQLVAPAAKAQVLLLVFVSKHYSQLCETVSHNSTC